jgi:hypothetical protein
MAGTVNANGFQAAQMISLRPGTNSITILSMTMGLQVSIIQSWSIETMKTKLVIHGYMFNRAISILELIAWIYSQITCIYYLILA